MKTLKSELLKYLFIFIAVVTSVVGCNIFYTDSYMGTGHGALISVLKILLLTVLTIAAVRIWEMRKTVDEPKELRWMASRKLLFLLFFVPNLFFLILHFPGLSYYDTMSQIIDMYDGTTTFTYWEGGQATITAFLNDHHPVTTTALFAAFVKFGEIIGSARVGNFIYLLLQIALYSLAYVRIIDYIKDSGAAARYFSIIFYAINPFLTYSMICMMKDSIHAVLFLLYLLEFHNAYENIGKGRDSKMAVWIIIYSVLLPLMKKTGIYIVAFANIVLLIKCLVEKAGRPAIIKIGLSIAIPVLIMFVLMPKLLFPALNIYPGGKQEMLATLFQQTAKVKLVQTDAYSDEEIAIIDAVFDYDAIDENFDPTITDPIKNTYRLSSVTDGQLKAYYKLWLKTGLRYPTTYIKATLGTCGGYFSPTEKLSVYTRNAWLKYSDEGLINLSLSKTGFLPAARDIAYEIFTWLCEVPGISIFSYIVVYTWWIPLYGTYGLIKRKGFFSVFSMTPIYIYILTLVVCPASLPRYALPLVLSTPMLLFVHKK